MRYILILLSLSTLAVAQQYGPPASGQTIQTPTKTYYNYYDQYGNPYLPGNPSQGRPYRNGTKIEYDNGTNYNSPNINSNGYNSNTNGYYPSSSVTGPPGQGRAYRENGKIIYR